MPDVVTSIWSLAVAGLHGERMGGGGGGGGASKRRGGEGERRLERGGGGGGGREYMMEGYHNGLGVGT